jgi:hypothetical protein
MTRLQAKAQARTKQVVGQMIGDDKLVVEGKEEERRAEEKGDAWRSRRPEPSEVGRQPSSTGLAA